VKRLPISLVALVAGLAMAAASCGSISSYAAKVDGKTISQSSLNTELNDIAANGPYLKLVETRQQVKGTGADTFDAAFTALALTRQIYYQLIGAELGKRKLSVTAADLAAARDTVVSQLQGEDVFKAFPKSYQDELVRRQADLDLLTLSLTGATGTVDSAARAYYDAHKDEFSKACVSHILLPTQAKADEVKARLDKGEDFVAVAKTESQDSASAVKGGELGCDVTQDTGYVAEFLLAVFNQPVGAVGTPVQTQFGFHLIKVTSRTQQAYDSVKSQVRTKLTTTGQEKLLTWLHDSVAKSKIEINPRYGTFDKQAESPGVVPPARPTDTSSVPAGIATSVPAAGGLPKP